MLELARLLQQNDSASMAVDLICFDAEDWGVPQWEENANADSWALGSQYWASTLHPSPSTRQDLYVYCEDTGSGIPKDAQARIFERFVKLNDFVQGTGLGLSICKAIIEKCGGKIGVDSEVGKGSTFWFRIPIEEKSEE